MNMNMNMNIMSSIAALVAVFPGMQGTTPTSDEVSWEETAFAVACMSDYIKAHGWNKGWDVDDAGRVCLRGAFTQAVSAAPFGRHAEQVTALLREVIAGYSKGNASFSVPGWYSIVYFNDDPDVTLADVMAVLEEAHTRALGRAAAEEAEAAAQEAHEAAPELAGAVRLW